MFHCESMCHEAHVKELTCLWVFSLFFFFFLSMTVFSTQSLLFLY